MLWGTQKNVIHINNLSESHSVVSGSVTPMDCPWNSLGQNIGVGSLSLLQGIFPTQGSNPGLLHCRQILYQLSHKGSPIIWVAYKIIWCREVSPTWSWKKLPRKQPKWMHSVRNLPVLKISITRMISLGYYLIFRMHLLNVNCSLGRKKKEIDNFFKKILRSMLYSVKLTDNSLKKKRFTSSRKIHYTAIDGKGFIYLK